MNKFAVVLVVAGLAAHGAHLNFDDAQSAAADEVRDTLPSLEALGFMSMGYTNLVADYYWLRAISHFGTKRMHAANYPNLQPLIERVLNLDPYFSAAYFFAGTTLTVAGQDPKASIRLLEQGMVMRPDDWRIPFLLGFNRFYFAHDYEGAALALATAARIPGAPEVAGPLAIRLSAEAGRPETGLQLLDTLTRDVKNKTLLATYDEKRRLLTLELYLKHLNEAARRYRAQTGSRPRSLGDLHAAGVITLIPEEPLGGRFFIDAAGVVQTTSEEKRLRLESPPEPPPEPDGPKATSGTSGTSAKKGRVR